MPSAGVATVHDWRLSELLRTYSKVKEPLELDEVELLSEIALGSEDLHVVCRALERGCKLKTAVKLFA